MVDTGIVQKLLELLDRHVEEGNVTVQHAALSALRNLAIPGEPPHSWNMMPHLFMELFSQPPGNWAEGITSHHQHWKEHRLRGSYIFSSDRLFDSSPAQSHPHCFFLYLT